MAGTSTEKGNHKRPGTAHKVDEILDKVNREGLRNLTWRERNFLRSASKRYKKNKELKMWEKL